MRYYVCNFDNIPLHSQPENGYTKLQAIERAQREVKECVELFGGKESDYTGYLHIMDSKFNVLKELDNWI
jgi:hypothetical protein